MSAPPRVRVAFEGAHPSRGAWLMRWRVRASPPIRLLRASAPRVGFRARERATSGDRVELRVRCGQGRATIENAFLIVTAARGRERWRVLARLRVRFAPDGTPRPAMERVSVQRVNFSGLEAR